MRSFLLALLFVSVAGFGLTAADPSVHWSLTPIRTPAVPTVKSQKPVLSEIDRFLLAELERKGLGYSAPAEPRTQVRRLYFDLIGLPPPPEVIDAFVKDPSDNAYEKLVDALLASPHYGERWARHWLDVVRYGESDGFERNPQRPNAWHYRDWVIRAFNDDMPYDRFAKLQIAGDVLDRESTEGVKATGFLVAGIHNTVVGSNPIMQLTARQEELEDIIGAVSQTFLGMSVQCARCHDHKFDPITQTDYYRMAASLAGVNFGDRKVIPSAIVKVDPRAQELEKQLAEFERQIATLDAKARARWRENQPEEKKPVVLAVAPYARWTFDQNADDESGRLKGTLLGAAKVAGGRLILDGDGSYLKTTPITKDISAKTLEVWLRLPTLDQGGGGAMTLQNNAGSIFDAIVFAERFKKLWVPGSNNYARTRDIRGEAENAAPADTVHIAIVYAADGSISTYRNGVPYGSTYKVGTGAVTYAGGKSQILFGLRHSGAGNGFLHGEIEEARLYEKALTADEVSASAKVGPGGLAPTAEQLAALLSPEEKAARRKWLAEKSRLESAKPPVVATQKGGGESVFSVVPRQPGLTHVLSRGSVERKRAEVTAGGVEVVPGKADFALPGNAPEADRRAKLAEWIARADNPLFARVIVNRIWQHHFGIGLVDTPSDFGKNGGAPSHPDLLDHLANKLIEDKFRLKTLHKLIVMSMAYRQSSKRNEAAVKLDADNRLLWRKSPTRLDAESVRDAILSTSGRLNTKAGGPGFLDTRAYGNAGTTYYEPIDPIGAEFERRTIYRFSPRGERSAVLETFDCPDPSAQTPRRQVTTTPLQALALWNNSLVLRMAKHLAERVEAECVKASEVGTAERIIRTYRLALGRGPDADELKAASKIVDQHGLAALARVLFNSNEFVVIE